MLMDTWLEEMCKEIEKDKPKDESKEIQLSESDIDKVADLMIKKMSESSFVDETKDKTKDKPKDADTQLETKSQESED